MDKAQAMKVMAESHRETVKELEREIKGWMNIAKFHQEKQKQAEDKNEPYHHQNKRYRDGIKQAISHFNYDEHQAGMFCLRKALRGDPHESS